MKKTTRQNEQTLVEQKKTVKELHEAELESVSGAALPQDCFHWKNSSKSWGF